MSTKKLKIAILEHLIASNVSLTSQQVTNAVGQSAANALAALVARGFIDKKQTEAGNKYKANNNTALGIDATKKGKYAHKKKQSVSQPTDEELDEQVKATYTPSAQDLMANISGVLAQNKKLVDTIKQIRAVCDELLENKE